MMRTNYEIIKYLSRVMEKSRSAMSLVERVEICLEGLGEAIGIKKSAVYLWSPENRCFVKGICSKWLPLKSQRIISQNILSITIEETIYYKLRKGQSVVIDGKESSSYLPDTKSIFVFPLIVKEVFLGIFVMDFGIISIRVDKNELLDLINMCSNHLSISIENVQLYERMIRENERYKEELNIAYTIQHSLLPRDIPTIAGINISAKSLPAKIVGGDFYYFKRFRADKHAIGIAIGDVAGKGVPAALIMAMALSTIEHCLGYFNKPEIAFANINSIIASHLEKYSPHYVSAFYGILNLKSNNFIYCKAGHPPPLWYRRAEKEVHTLDVRGTVFGLFKGKKFEQKTVQLRSGDKIIFYTDGITEARNEEGELFGVKRLKEIITRRKDVKPLQLNTSIFRAVRRFIGRKIQEDDMTLITIEIL